MNHYEELGIESDAPVEEIRQAYKTLVRLLHPDGQTDESVAVVRQGSSQRAGGGSGGADYPAIVLTPSPERRGRK